MFTICHLTMATLQECIISMLACDATLNMHVQVRFSFDEPDFAMIDTLFSLAEAHLFMQLVELQDSRPDLLPSGKAYPDLYRCAAATPCCLQSPATCTAPHLSHAVLT